MASHKEYSWPSSPRICYLWIQPTSQLIESMNVQLADREDRLCSVQFSLSVVFDSLWPHGLQHARPPCPSITNSWSPSKLMSIEVVMPSNHLILCRPLLLLPSIFPSIRVFSNESALHLRWSKYWSFSPSNEHPGLISFRMDWLDLLAVHRTLKSLFPTPQLKSINSLVFSFLYSPTLTSMHDHWKKP